MTHQLDTQLVITEADLDKVNAHLNEYGSWDAGDHQN